MGCCNCCCPEDGEECCRAPGPNGICCSPDKCCNTSSDPICCLDDEECCTPFPGTDAPGVCCPPEKPVCCQDCESIQDVVQPYCCEEGEACCVCECCPPGSVCCNEACCPEERCCEDVCCEEGECCVGGECEPCGCEEDADCPEGQCCNDGECGPCPCSDEGDCEEGEQCCFDERFTGGRCYPYFLSCTITSGVLSMTQQCEDFLDNNVGDASDCCPDSFYTVSRAGDGYICSAPYAYCSLDEFDIVPLGPIPDGFTVECGNPP